MTRLMRIKSDRTSRRREGTVSVEFALTVPILFTMFFGSFEVCRVSMLMHTVKNAAYEGARAGIMPGASAAMATTAAEAELGYLGITGETITVNPSTILSTTDEVTVTVTVPIGDNSWVKPFYMQGFSLTRSATLTSEYNE